MKHRVFKKGLLFIFIYATDDNTLFLKVYKSFQSDLNLPFISDSVEPKEALKTVNSYLSAVDSVSGSKVSLILKNQNPSLTDRTVINIIDMLNSSDDNNFVTYGYSNRGEICVDVHFDKSECEEHIAIYEMQVKIYKILTNKLYLNNISLSDVSIHSDIGRIVVKDALMNNNLTGTTKKELEEAMSALFERDMVVTIDKLNIVVE